MLAFIYDNPSFNPAEVYYFFCVFVVEKNENKQKEVWLVQFLLLRSACLLV